MSPRDPGLAATDPEIASLISHEEERQRQKIRLIASENYASAAVLEASGVDSERYTGWAFGMGPARIAISRYAIPDIRLLYDSDVRFLDRIAE